VDATGTDALLQNVDAYRRTFDKADAAKVPRTGVAVVACMDARLNPFGLLSLSEGDAHVIRNAGGVVTDDTLRSLTISQRELGTTDVMVVGHHDCGMRSIDDEAFAVHLESQTGSRPAWAAGGFADPGDAVRESLARLRDCPFLASTGHIRGFLYDESTGDLTEVA